MGILLSCYGCYTSFFNSWEDAIWHAIYCGKNHTAQSARKHGEPILGERQMPRCDYHTTQLQAMAYVLETEHWTQFLDYMKEGALNDDTEEWIEHIRPMLEEFREK